MENKINRNKEKRSEEASDLSPASSGIGEASMKAGAEPQKEADIIEIEAAIGPRKSYIPAKKPFFDHFDKKIFEYEDEISPPHWAVPWSDIMMVVFVMFAVLFIYSVSKRDIADAFRTPNETRVEVPRQEVRQEITPEQLNEMSQRLRKDTKSDEISVGIDKDQSIKISASDSLFFDLGKADIKPDAIKFLRDFAEVVKKTKSNIRIEGHTDSFPIHSPAFPTNWELSAIRAVNIARFLIEETGIEPERFTVVGHSLYKPAVPNTTLENKAKNRRVEIFINKNNPSIQNEG
ncbi:MAG TPA: OmpA family protein [Syntrophales bacterium]|nr:OmpA family protein [Syntrophales bacterium]